jgi:uncharacterized RDD family membrane protein YckC
MKCPKCGYIGFDIVDRCKNCGYEFSLINQETAASDRSDAPVTRGARFRKTPGGAAPTPGVDRRLASLPEGTPMDLPLFGEGFLPLPRAPLAVRRSTPTPSRVRARTEGRRPVPLELDLEAPVAVPQAEAQEVAPLLEPMVAAGADAVAPVASASRRLSAAAMDTLLLGGIDAVLLSFTLRLCGLSPSEIGVLPLVPLLTFLALLNGGYLILFTGTLGQTLGKMAVGIRVVPVNREAMDLRRAVWRTLAMLLSIGPAGLGFLPAVVGDFRALHDRLAGTRVIQHAAAS